MADVFEGGLEEVVDVVVGEGVVDRFAFAAVVDHAGVAQDAELVGDGGLAHPEDLREVGDGEFLPGEGRKYAHAGGIPEGLQ